MNGNESTKRSTAVGGQGCNINTLTAENLKLSNRGIMSGGGSNSSGSTGSAGSGSDDKGTTSTSSSRDSSASSGNPAVVTETTNGHHGCGGKNASTSSSSSGSGSGTSSLGGEENDDANDRRRHQQQQRRQSHHRVDDASSSGDREYYYAGYGSGPSLRGGDGDDRVASNVGGGGGGDITHAAMASASAAAPGPPPHRNRRDASNNVASRRAVAFDADCGGGSNRNDPRQPAIESFETAGHHPSRHHHPVRHHHHHQHHHQPHQGKRSSVDGVVDGRISAAADDVRSQGSINAAASSSSTNRFHQLQQPQQQPQLRAVVPFLNGIPSAINGPTGSRYNRNNSNGGHHHHRAYASAAAAGAAIVVPRLPQSDERAVLQRVPRTHATVVAHDLPPPPTSSDAWSSTSNGSSSRSNRGGGRRGTTQSSSGGAAVALAGGGGKIDVCGANNRTSSSSSSSLMSRHHHHAVVASVRLSNGGAIIDSVGMNERYHVPSSSPDSSSEAIQGGDQKKGPAMHVTMDDPILRKKISLKQQQQQPRPTAEYATSTSSQVPSSMLCAPPVNAVGVNCALKRKISSMTRDNGTSCGGDDSSDGSKSDEGCDMASSERQSGSGSDEGYAASSERQSGSGGDSMSSDDDNKEKMMATPSSRRVGVGGASSAGFALSNGMVRMTMSSQSNSKRTETSSMSSSVLADFSSVMNEDASIALNSLSRSDSPRSSCTSISSRGENQNANASGHNKASRRENAKAEVRSEQHGAERTKRDSANLDVPSSSSAKARKRTKSTKIGAKSSSSCAGLDEYRPPNNAMKSGLSIMEKLLHQKVQTANHHYHSRSTGRKMLEKSFLSAKRDLSTADAFASTASTAPVAKQGVKFCEGQFPSNHVMRDHPTNEEATIYLLGHDVMAQVASYLDPPEAYSFLTTPLSKTWLIAYTAPQELWKILCTSAPFYAKLDDDNGGSDSSSCSSFPMCNDMEMRHLFGRYRLLYTSFIRCMKYLNRLQDDALNGRVPTLYANSNQNDIYPYNKNTSLKAYFAKARRLNRSRLQNGGSRSSSDAALSFTSESGSRGSSEKALQAGSGTEALAKGPRQGNSSRRLGRSMLTDRLLRPTQAGDVNNVNLPWSCAIYSVVNWMVAFADVEGIQIMCLKCLPYLLEDESQRTTAQRAGLTDSVLRAMVLFPDSIELHTVAFHTLVLLARPLGGNEGMLFHTAMVNTRGIFNNGSSSSKNGIVIMLDSMRRFAHDEILQAMSCWSLVNVALTPLQKSMLVKLGGLTVTSNAMLQHPYNAEVQFRALFALINLVIPTETRPEETEEMREFEREIFQQLGELGETSEMEMLSASVGQISNLVVVAMKNFCSSEAILNRACLVLHNLSLNEEYHSTLLWTPNCYQMLEWCLGNYPHDHVLLQSAGGTIQRLNATLSADDDLRERFTHSLRAQQQHALDMSRQEAVLLQEQQRDQTHTDAT